MLTLYAGNDNLIEWDRMRLGSNESYVNNATVTFALKADTDGAPGTAISGASGTLTYVTASDGKYQGTLESMASLTPGVNVWLCITATSGSLNGLVEELCEVKRRGARL